jgi:hypothetical protein
MPILSIGSVADVLKAPFEKAEAADRPLVEVSPDRA